MRFGQYETWFDRAHNTVLDVMSMTGVFGLIGFLAIYLAIFYSSWRAYKKGWIDLPIAAMLFALPIAYFVQNLFVFDHPAGFTMSYLLFALVVGATQKDFVGEPWISFSKEPTIEGNTVKATIKTDLTFNTVNLSGRPYPRTAYPQLIGFYDLKVTDSKTTVTKQFKINAYDNYHTWEEMKPTIDKLIETSESKSDRYFEYRSIGKSTEVVA